MLVSLFFRYLEFTTVHLLLLYYCVTSIACLMRPSNSFTIVHEHKLAASQPTQVRWVKLRLLAKWRQPQWPYDRRSFVNSTSECALFPKFGSKPLFDNRSFQETSRDVTGVLPHFSVTLTPWRVPEAGVGRKRREEVASPLEPTSWRPYFRRGSNQIRSFMTVAVSRPLPVAIPPCI